MRMCACRIEAVRQQKEATKTCPERGATHVTWLIMHVCGVFVSLAMVHERVLLVVCCFRCDVRAVYAVCYVCCVVCMLMLYAVCVCCMRMLYAYVACVCMRMCLYACVLYGMLYAVYVCMECCMCVLICTTCPSCVSIKPGKVVIVTAGRFAGKKAIVVKTFDDGTKEREFAHALIAGIERVSCSIGW